LILFVLSGLSGFVIGKSLSWRAIVVAGAVIALLTAIMLQKQGFTPLAGIFTIVACLIVNQLAYLLAVRLTGDPSGGSTAASPEQSANGVPRDDGHNDVRHNHKRDQDTQFDPARLASW
jgi:asparagine N-glycosylation enzyme membrane subunit Stt3